MADLENKLRGEKTLGLCLVPKNIKERKKNAKENDFIIFSYLLKKYRLCLILRKY